jgi:hypothetical protein
MQERFSFAWMEDIDIFNCLPHVQVTQISHFSGQLLTTHHTGTFSKER